MKSRHLSVAALLMAGCLLSTSCVGSFGLFNRLAQWNKKATDYKIVNELIFLIITPAYAVCSVVDALVLNSIEFWSGSNPMASNVGKTQQVLGEDGVLYAVKTLKDGYEITKPTGEKLLFTYDKKTDSWSKMQDGKTQEILRFNANGTVKATLPGGQAMDVSLNESGLQQVRGAIAGGTWWAMR